MSLTVSLAICDGCSKAMFLFVGVSINHECDSCILARGGEIIE